MTDILHSSELIKALESERHSETITMFQLSYPQTEVNSERFVRKHWSLFRRHIDLDKIEILKNNTSVGITLPAWLGGECLEFNFWEDGGDAIVVDCIDLRMKYEYLSKVFVDNR